MISIIGYAAAPLKPEKEYGEINRIMTALLTQFHYAPPPVDVKMSNRIFERYLKMLDAQKVYFLASDIEAFSQFKNSFANDLYKGDLSKAYFMYQRLQEQIAKQNTIALSLIDQSYDFTLEESIDLERDKAVYAASQHELDQVWAKRIKYELLNIMLNDKTLEEAKETLKKRYAIRMKRSEQTESSDVFQMYMNAVTESFDPHSSYFSPRVSENFNISMSLKLNGIGTVLRQDEDSVKIVEVVAGGPADLSGALHVSDEIIAVAQGEKGEWVDLYGMRLDDVVEKIRGERGTIVRLQVVSGKHKGPAKEVKIVRDTINLDKQAAKSSVKTMEIEGQNFNIGIIKLPTFYADFEGEKKGNKDLRSTTKDVKTLLQELIKKGIDGLVIDLRGNGGGSLVEAINLSGLFLDGQTVVQIKSHDGKISAEKSAVKKALYRGPMLVLVDRLSASASEIFAGSMQDQGRALIVGSTTYGKGTVQTVLPLDRFVRESKKTGQLKLTISKFYRASGSSTQHRGVEPDIMIPSAFDPSKIGESAQEFPMLWDEIKPAKDFVKKDNFSGYLPLLLENHEQRLQTNPSLKIYLQQVEKGLKAWQEKTFSLNLAARQQRQKMTEKTAFESNNALRVLAGLPILTEEEFKNSQEYEVDNEKNVKPDIVLDESVRILLDLLHLQAKVAS